MLMIHSLKLTFSHLNMDDWKMGFLLGWPNSQGRTVSFGEGFDYSLNIFEFHPMLGVASLISLAFWMIFFWFKKKNSDQ